MENPLNPPGTASRIEVPLGDTHFDPEAFLKETIRWEPPSNRFVENVTSATLTLHRPAPASTPLPVVLICPGGGYAGVSIDNEGHHFAAWLNRLGFAAAVLKYRCPPRPAQALPDPFVDAIEALTWLGDHAEDDAAVPPANSRVLLAAAQAHGCPAEAHFCSSGGHGFGMGSPGSQASTWLAPCADWLIRICPPRGTADRGIG